MNDLQIPAFKIVQNKTEMLIFCCPNKVIYERFDVSRRIDDKILGYQRSFSNAKIKQIKNYILNENGVIPNSVLVNIDSECYSYSEDENLLTLQGSQNSLGLIIDGQHRLKGCYEANPEFEIVVVAVLGLLVKEQAGLFVTINKTQTGVPASLYLDLMNLLEGDIEDFDGEEVSTERRATEIAIRLNEDPNSPLYELIRRTGESGLGISLNEFVRQIKDYVAPGKGKLAGFGFEEQYKIFRIYFRAIKAVFIEQWENENSYILKTVGFGGLMKAFYEIFNIVLQQHQKFDTDNLISTFKFIEDFKFDRDTLPSGGGVNAQKAAGELIIRSLKEKMKNSENLVSIIGE
ncbi:DGQHR domain-containing protein [Picosynechococcus sp. PCC 11901]|uniref:DGQHR domain-containing protein n=1 Tax=Picosynechococcus sp. PCC 11901 TaxID=2579791 RepID=UPI0010FC3A27|nr:DGQHR domain-containing protein [Picosynechococcus sp. PCC 11901]QCS50224.1 DGQHR domain-containing protein [Picosynechococcus sp. PCC 11901]